MPNVLSTGKFKSFTPGLLLSSGMEINNSLLFDINFVRLNPPLLHILMTFFTRVFAVSRSSTDFNRNYIEVVLDQISCFFPTVFNIVNRCSL